MTSDLKNLSNPFSTGGGGHSFENRVQTAFAVLMLAEGFLPCLPEKKISKLNLQGKRLGFHTDDIIAYTNDIRTNSEHKLLAQIKHDISVTKNDKQFQEVITAAWADFNNSVLFNKGKDVIALITGPLSKSDIYDTRIILEWARHSENATDYFENKINLRNFSSENKRKKTGVFRDTLKTANGNKDVSDDLIFSFLRHFYILGYDMDIKDGVIHSLLTSIISQFQPPDQVISIWARISYEISFCDQYAEGTITKDTLSEKIPDFFKKEKINTIPKDLVKPTVDEPPVINIEKRHENLLFIASILGEWNVNSNGDNEIIGKLAGESKRWIDDIQAIKKNSNEIFSLKNGHWQVKRKIDNLSKYALFFYDSHLDLIKEISLKVLSEVHPMFDLNPENRIASAMYRKYPRYSVGIRKGISETLVFLSIHGKELKNCSQHKQENTVFLTLRELFNNAGWKLWASLNDLLPILAEADPTEFLSSVENGLKQSPCPFDELFKQEGEGGITRTNYMTGLNWALETLAWNEEHLSRSILALAGLAVRDPGGRWANRPINSIITILLPWLPQTISSFDKRIASLKGVQRNCPDVAWKILIELLPNQNRTSMGSNKPIFRNYIPEDWEEGVSTAEYWKQVKEYAAMAVDMAKGNSNYILELVDNLENIPQPSLDNFLKCIPSDEIAGLTDEQRVTIWEKMISLVRKHRHFSDSKWALPTETIDILEQVAEKISPSSLKYLYRHMFSNKDFDYYDRDEDWQAHQEKLKKERIEALKQIYETDKIDSVVKFAENVENPARVGDIFAYIANEENDYEILPSFLNYQEQYKKQFISGFIWTRYRNGGMNWVEGLNIMDWANEQKCNLFLYLPFDNEIWEKVNKYFGERVDIYWKTINAYPFPIQGSFFPAIENLLKYGRPRFAFACIYVQYHSKNELFKEYAIRALIDGISSNEPIGDMDSYNIIEIIKILQDDPNIDEKDLFKIEWAYLPIFDSEYNIEPKLLERYLSQKPNFFIEVIQLLYRSKNGKSEKKIYKKGKYSADNAWKLLNEWKRPPGKMDDGSFSVDSLKKWIDEVKTKTIKSGHYDIAMSHLGHVLFYAGSDSSGLWIQRSVAEILDDVDNDNIRQGFRSEIYNSRGAHFVDPSGKDEKALADLWRKNAEEIENLGLIRFATLLKDLARSYDREAEQVKSRYSHEQESENNKKENNDN